MVALAVRYCLFCTLCGISLANAAEKLHFKGTAFSLDNNALLYTEYHEIKVNTLGQYERGEVIYRDENGQVIATKVLDFSLNALVPNLVFKDHRSQSDITLSRAGSDLIVEYFDGVKNRTHKTRFKPNGSGNPLVADAGFDRFVLKNWNKILAGEKLVFDMLALTRGETIPFQMSMINKTSDQVAIEVKPDSWLVRLLVKPIHLSYELNSQKLMRFEGLTNIQAEENGRLKDENAMAKIVYEYE